MLLYTIYLVAIVAEAMSGAIMGMRRGMDLFGICMIGTVTALGGGTIRDVLLGHYPLGWIAHPEYLLFMVGAAVVTAVVARYLHHLRTVFLLVDGLGLVAFCVIGCDIAMSAKMHPAIVVLAGMITGVFGGLLRRYPVQPDSAGPAARSVCHRGPVYGQPVRGPAALQG
jgi:uncharacterized membrane protein YeiH